MVRFIILILTISFSLTSCQVRGLTTEDVFPSQIKSDSLLVISFDSIDNLTRLNELFCQYKNDYIRVPDGYIRLNNNLDIPIFQSNWSKCQDNGIIGCYKESSFIKIKKDSFISVIGLEKLDISTLENHLTKRFLNPKSMFISEAIFTAFIIEIPNNTIIERKNIDSKLSIISNSYFNFLKKHIPKDSIMFYREKYPFILMIEKPFNEVLKSPPPPFSERILISD